MALAGVGEAAAQVRARRRLRLYDSLEPSFAWSDATTRRLRRDDRRVPGALRHAARTAGRGQAPARLQSAGLALRRARARPRRWKTTSVPARVLKAIDRRALPAARTWSSRTPRRNADFLAPIRRIDRATGSRCASSVQTSPLFRPGWSRPRAVLAASSTASSSRTTGSRRSSRPPGSLPRSGFRIAGTGQLESLLEARLPRTSSGCAGSIARRSRPSCGRAGCALGIFGAEREGRARHREQDRSRRSPAVRP